MAHHHPASPSQASFSCKSSLSPYGQHLLHRCDYYSLDLDSIAELPENYFPPEPHPAPSLSYLDSVAEHSQKISCRIPVNFNHDRLRGGQYINRHGNPSYFVLCSPGLYLVEYHVFISGIESSQSLGGLTLLLNGSPVEGSDSMASVCGSHSVANLSASTLIELPPASKPASMALVGKSDGSFIVNSGNILIIRWSEAGGYPRQPEAGGCSRN